MLAALAALLLLASVAGFVWLTVGPIGQRGRAIRRENGGKWGRNSWIGLILGIVLIVVSTAHYYI